MEYQFIHDAVTGNARAKFSFEHQVIGPWLEVEVGQSSEKLTQVLTGLDDVASGQQQEVIVAGREYSVTVNGDDVQVQANAMLNGEEVLPESLTSEHINLDSQDSSTCGIEDFRALLLAWAKFTKC